MKRIWRLLFISAIVILTVASCKSKQKVVDITGADVKATETTKTVQQQQQQKQQQTAEMETTEGNERTINEKFSMAAGETNTAAFNRKYHVVVGSFSVQANAQNLQRTLKGEGNDALIVVNERGMYRVLIASYDEYSQARARINQINSRFPDAWVLMQK